MKVDKEPIKRSYNFEVRAREEPGEEEKRYIIEGRPIVYDSVTDLGYMYEVIDAGALDGADMSDVRMLVNHNTYMIPLARCLGKKGTMQLTADDKGLMFDASLDVENNTDARSLYSAVSRGDVTGMSFMFFVDTEEWEDLESDKPTRRIKKISTVLEISAVTFPAYEDTEIYTRDKRDLETARRMLEARKSNGELTGGSRNLPPRVRAILRMYGGKER